MVKVLKVVGGNPLAIRGNANRESPYLSLVWQQEGILAAKKSDKKPTVSTPTPIPTPSRWEWFKETAERIGTLVAVAVSVLGILGTVIWVTWHVSKYDSRLEAIEKDVGGTGGLREQVKELRGDVAGVKENVAGIKENVAEIRATVQSLDRYFLSQMKDRAAQLLGTPNVNIYRTYALSNEEACSLARGFSPLSEPRVSLTFCIVSVEKDAVVVRVQAEQEVNGETVGDLKEQFISLRLPSRVGEQVGYDVTADDIKIRLPDGRVVSPSLHYEFVLLERYGPNELTLASAVTESKAAS